MTYIYDTLKGQKKIDWAYSELRHEEHKGTHTYTMCDCGRMMCRSNKCILCWKEDIANLESKLKVKLKSK